jgi:glycosyltransferase involved in cell wall biosynthesis
LNEQKIKTTVIIPARNESNFLGSTLDALKHQTFQSDRIVVVNDGSTDNTSDVAKSFNVDVIDLPDRGYRATGKPILADVINKGLESIKNNECKYILILGSDHVLSPDYVSKIIEIMEQDDQTVIASGIIKGEPQRDTSPRGSGRVVRYDYWKKLGLQYPLGYGFESYIVYKALVNCFNVRVIRNAISWSQRPTGKTTNYRNYGKAMKSLGYHPLYAMGRIALTLKHNPKNAIHMTLGYFERNTKKYDIASKVCKFQSGEIKKKIKLIIRSKL